jgi:hypothetical protein
MAKQPTGMRIGEPDFVFDSQKRQIPRRIVRLKKNGDVRDVLATFEGDQIVGSKIHAAVQSLAAEHAGDEIALEWLGNLGWVRYLTCRK